jgi:integrase/recombinase XerD
MLGLAPNTIAAYAYAVEEFVGFCERESIDVLTASRESITRYVGELRTRPRAGRANIARIDSGCVLSNATLQQRITAIRLFFEFLIDDELRKANPVSRGQYTLAKRFGCRQQRPLIQRFTQLPWIPSEAQWSVLLGALGQESIRNRCMFALAYDAALRREELCRLESDDFDPAHRILRIRAETTKGHRERTIPYSSTSGELLRDYLRHRRNIAGRRGAVFLSESPRNFAAPITLWTWSKVIRSIAVRAGILRFSTHTLRHLCLTDLARAGWELHAIARFAGHQNLETTKRYVHISGRDLAEHFQRSMNEVHAWRVRAVAEVPTSVGRR